MAFGSKVKFEAVREIDFGSILASYVAVGTGTTDHSRIIRFVNGTDVQVLVSLDGTTDNIRMSADSFIIFDFSSNKITDHGLFVSVGTTFFVKRQSGAPTTGSFWIEVISAIGGI